MFSINTAVKYRSAGLIFIMTTVGLLLAYFAASFYRDKLLNISFDTATTVHDRVAALIRIFEMAPSQAWRCEVRVLNSIRVNMPEIISSSEVVQRRIVIIHAANYINYCNPSADAAHAGVELIRAANLANIFDIAQGLGPRVQRLIPSSTDAQMDQVRNRLGLEQIYADLSLPIFGVQRVTEWRDSLLKDAEPHIRYFCAADRRECDMAMLRLDLSECIWRHISVNDKKCLAVITDRLSAAPYQVRRELVRNADLVRQMLISASKK
jgi:hypothetical protein